MSETLKHVLFFTIAALMGCPSTFADEGKGAGFVLFHALTRNYEKDRGPLFNCANVMKQNELYLIDIFPLLDRPRVLTKTAANGDCTLADSIEMVQKRHDCFLNSLEDAYALAKLMDQKQQSNLNELENLGFFSPEESKNYSTRIVVRSTSSALQFINRSVWDFSWLVDWLPTREACPFEIHIQHRFQSRGSERIIHSEKFPLGQTGS